MLQLNKASGFGVTANEVSEQAVELLPQRAALGSLVDLTNVGALNIALAINAATLGSIAGAQAVQGIGVP